MKNIALKNKKKIVNDFLKDLNQKLGFYQLDIEVLSYLSARGIYKLLKAAKQADGIQFNKKKLKGTSKFLNNILKEKQDKKSIEKAFKQITTTNIELFIDKTASDILKASEEYRTNEFKPTNVFTKIKNKNYLLLGVLRI
ncbi:MAG: hypothetical protein KAG04_02350 [Mycoplasmataceae bacterium]|nr:hypothetical protein [Mycoplasmataceae bacterium]